MQELPLGHGEGGGGDGGSLDRHIDGSWSFQQENITHLEICIEVED